VDVCSLTRITSVGPIDESGRLLKGGVGVTWVVAAGRNLRKDGDVSEQRADELQNEEVYQEWMSSLWREIGIGNMRDEGMRMNGDSSSAFIQILLAEASGCTCTYVLYRVV
jgi:hypothetical protein